MSCPEENNTVAPSDSPSPSAGMSSPQNAEYISDESDRESNSDNLVVVICVVVLLFAVGMIAFIIIKNRRP